MYILEGFRDLLFLVRIVPAKTKSVVSLGGPRLRNPIRALAQLGVYTPLIRVIFYVNFKILRLE